MKTVMEARLRFYIRPQWRDGKEWEERSIGRATIRQLLECVRYLQELPGFRDADVFCKDDEDSVMVEWLAGTHAFSVIVNPTGAAGLFLDLTHDDIKVEHGHSREEIIKLYEAFAQMDHP